MGFLQKKREAKEEDQQKLALLELAERDLCDLQERAACAIKTLEARRQRNHWRETIEQLMQGASY